MMKTTYAILLLLLLPAALPASNDDGAVRIKELARLGQARDNLLTGYGLVTGLAGTGDTSRAKATLQSQANMLTRFGVHIASEQMRSRNVAAVMLTATLNPFVRPGDKMDVNVTSMGDARSLLGGTLLMAHLTGPDGKTYALAQGPLSVGGFTYDLNGNLVQKNHPTAAHLPGGATVEASPETKVMDDAGVIEYVLNQPDFTTAHRIAESINTELHEWMARAVDAGRVQVQIPEARRTQWVSLVTRIENLSVIPDHIAVVVINERTGTVVSGGDVRIAKVSITHGDLKVAISTDYRVSQPVWVRQTGDGVRTQVVPDSDIQVDEEQAIQLALPQETTVTDLVSGLNKVKASSRDIITILQAVKRAGALHAELIIQ